MADEPARAWICTACGYVHDGDEPPDTCPMCAVPKDCFVPHTDEAEEEGEILLDDALLGGGEESAPSVDPDGRPGRGPMSQTLETLQRVTAGLARDIGMRRAGSDADRRAADLLEQELGAVCPEVVRHEYRFLGWDPANEGQLDLGGQVLGTRLGIACPPTPAEGLTGVLRPVGPSVYGLWEPGRVGPAAHLMAYQGEGGAAIPLLWHPVGALPAGIVSAAEGAFLADAARSGETVTFTCRPRLEPAATSWNVEGILPGDPRRHVIVAAHYDTVYASPGANDNAASCACLPALAARLAASPGAGRPTLHFLATGAEEIDLQGARCYVRDLVWEGRAADVQLCLNFDSLTWGNGLKIGACARAEPYLPLLAEALGESELSQYDGDLERVALGQGVDSAVFHAADVPTLNANTAGDAGTVALWHTPQDTVDRVPWGRAVDGAEVFGRFLERLQ